MAKTVLVTGGAGYIGSHTCKYLDSKGYIPIVLDNLVYGHREFVKWGPFYEGDIRDSSLLDEIFSRHKPEAVIHFAAYGYVGESVTDPAKYYQNNVAGTLSLLDAMRRGECWRIVFSSTCATYGEPEQVPITEDEPRNPINPYGMSKLMVERILADYDNAYGIKHGALRYFNAAGADMDGELGEEHSPETHLIPLIVGAGLGKRSHIEIYGTDYDTPDGTAIRDYIHVTDLADAHVRMLEFLGREEKSLQLNLGTGSGHSVKEVIGAVEAVSGRSISVKVGPRRPGDPPELIADATRAAKLLGWKPEFSDLTTIVKSAWNWHNTQNQL